MPWSIGIPEERLGMFPIKRRKFLQLVGSSTLATLALSQFNLQQQGNFNRVFAQSLPRKLALLVGINDYADSGRLAPLQGCITDVELQQQLLIHRFGFNPIDILTLTNAQATRQGILEAFEEHLIQQAQPGDVIVFHFSGYSCFVADPDCDFPDCLLNTLVPVDSTVQPDGSVSDIAGNTLWLLLAALNTENVTVVIDASHSGGFTRSDVGSSSSSISKPIGKTRDRTSLKISTQEQAYQQQWLKRLSLSPSEFKERRQAGIAKGMLLTASQRGQLSSEGGFNDFYAGTFTYLLTQYLWQQPGNEQARNAFANIVRGVTPLSFTAQIPQLAIKPNSGNELRPIYFLERRTPPAEAVITQVEGEKVKLWLGGIEPKSLLAFTQGAMLTIIDNAGKEQGLVQLESCQGLVGVGKVLKATPNKVQVGALLQERIRGIPDNLTLRLGLDPSLGNNLAQVQKALQEVKFIEVLPLEDEVDYILGRMNAAYSFSQKTALTPVGSIGLFLPRRVIVPGSFGASGETVMDAVKRLQPKFKSLLATRVVKLALNSNSSRLKVTAWMTREDNTQDMIANAFALRGSSKKSVPGQANTFGFGTSGTAPVLPIATYVQLHIANHESYVLYCSILVIDSSREISVIFPNKWAATEDITRVEAGQTLLIPDSNKDNFRLVTQEPKGVAEVLIIASRKPLRKTLLSLRAIASRGGLHGGPIALDAPDDPTNVIANLLDDLDAGNETNNAIATTNNPGVHHLDTTQLAVLSIPFEVI
ncbi:MAG: caspase family protein [Cyanobacteriota bacterium]